MKSRAAGPDAIWFFAVDGGRGRLLKCTRTPPGRLHVDEVSAIANETPPREHGRPSPRAGKSGNTYASGGHEDDHNLHLFAKEVVAWVGTQVSGIETPTVVLFAPPRFLGELRKLYGSDLSGRLVEHQADLTHLSPAALAKHPAIAGLWSD